MSVTVTREIWGLRCELIELLMVLLATAWQGAFTDWFDKTSRDWLGYIQEDVNVAVLRSLDDLSTQMKTTDDTERQKLRLQILDTTQQAITKAIQERNGRRDMDNGQASVFGVILYMLIAIGAILVILGKWLVLVHKRSNPGVQPTR